MSSALSQPERKNPEDTVLPKWIWKPEWLWLWEERQRLQKYGSTTGRHGLPPPRVGLLAQIGPSALSTSLGDHAGSLGRCHCHCGFQNKRIRVRLTQLHPPSQWGKVAEQQLADTCGPECWVTVSPVQNWFKKQKNKNDNLFYSGTDRERFWWGN